MQHILRSRGVVAVSSFLLWASLSIVGASPSGAAAGCDTSGAPILEIDVADGDAELSFSYAGGWKLSVDICAGGPYNFSTTYDSIEVIGDANEANVVTFDAYDDLTVTDDMVAFWHGSGRADDGISISLGSQSSYAWNDTVAFEGSTGNDLVVADDFADYTSVEYFTFYGRDGKDTLYGKTDIRNDMQGGDEHDILHGGSEVDILDGGADRDTIYGMGDADFLYGGDGVDEIYGEVAPASEIALIGSPSSDVMLGEGGDDELFGNEGDDAIDGGAGDDLLYGGSGNDFLRGGEDDEGTDHSFGETGDDVFDECASLVYGYDESNPLGTCSSDVTGDDVLDGGTGNDMVDYGNRSGDVQVVLPQPNTASPNVTTGNGDIASGENDALWWIESAVGGWGDDRLIGNSWANTIDPGPDGYDDMKGFTGADTVSFRASDCGVRVDLGAGYNGRSTVQTFERLACGSSGDQSMTGFDNVTGSPYDDVLEGSDGPNRIEGREGEDELSGMASTDRFIEGSDPRSEDDIAGGLGLDTVDYSGRPYGDGDEGVAVSLDGEGDVVVEDFITSVENVIGTDGEDYLRGTASRNLLYGLDGDDELVGLAGNDRLYGGTGADVLFGGDGDDMLDGEDDGDADTFDGGTNTGSSTRRVDHCFIEDGETETACEYFLRGTRR